MSSKFDVHEHITARIAAQIEAGAGDFVMPWHRSRGATINRPCNVASKKRYRGINVLSLWMDATEKSFASDTWGTYRQWQETGAQVRKGEKSSIVVAYKDVTRKADPSKGNDEDQTYFLARAANVFNACQVDGWQDAPQPPQDHGPIERIERADAFISSTGARIGHGGQSAYYRPSTDEIQMPDETLFIATDGTRQENYYSTLFHELTHWSGAKHRLDRAQGSRFSDPKYAFEELVAELGAAFLCGSLGLCNEPRKDHARYIANWLAALKNDRRAIFTAASLASKASDYLEGLAAAPAVPMQRAAA